MLELAKVVKIVDIVAVALGRRSLTAGREPDRSYTDGGEARERFRKAFPVGIVGGNIPLETLEKSIIFGGGLTVCSSRLVSSTDIPDSALLLTFFTHLE